MKVSGQLHTRPLFRQGRAYTTHWREGWEGPGAGLDALKKKKLFCII